jgi:L-asparaginase/Glu-tRNA(Gln) amidotransferase subunit D
MTTKPRIHVLALGGTIATRPDASGAMQMGLGADDLVAAVPLLETCLRAGLDRTAIGRLFDAFG